MSKIKVDQIESVDGVADITLNNDLASLTVTGTSTLTGNVTASGDVTMSSMNGGQLAGRRNLIINGAMNVWQRGTSGTLAATNNYLVDRFHGSRLGGLADIFDASQVTDVPTGQGFKYSYKVTQDGTSTTLSGTNAAMFGYRPEGQDWYHLGWGTANAKSITVQFWVKSSITGTFAFTIASNNSDQDIAKEYTIDSANTWEKKTFTIPGPTSGTWTSDNSAFGYITWGWCGVLGSARETTNIDSWGAGSGGSSVTVTANSTNALATTSGATWQITGIQIESGSVATPFENRSYGEEISLCQRYYSTVGFPTYSTFATGQFTYNPATSMGTTLLAQTPGGQMRVTPTMTFDQSASDFYAKDTTGGTKTLTGLILRGYSGGGTCQLQATSASSFGNDDQNLNVSGTGASFQFDSEL